MLLREGVRTASWTCLVLALAAFLGSMLAGCCASDEWRTVTFRQAQLEFAVPGDWTVRFREPGRDPLTVAPGEELGASAMLSDGAVLTALPVLEDAAMVILVTEPTVRPEYLAQHVKEFVPLDAVTPSPRNEPYQANGLSGFASEGSGRLPNEGADVYFRTLVLEVGGRAILVTLYAEKSQQRRYEVVFDRILGSLKALNAPPGLGVSPGPEAPPGSAASAPMIRPDAGGMPPSSAPSAPEEAPSSVAPASAAAPPGAPEEAPASGAPPEGLPAPRDGLEGEESGALP